MTLKHVVDRFRGTKILVIGDVMLDKYIMGEADRLSPEAPVPVVKVQEVRYVPGGAANTALNVASLGGDVTIIGEVGADTTKSMLVELLRRNNVKTRFITTSKGTIYKTRIVVGSHQIVRVDHEKIKPALSCDRLEYTVENVLRETKPSVVVIADYNKGAVTEEAMKGIIRLCEKYNACVIVDSKKKEYTCCKGARLITPNNKEARASTEMPTEDIKYVARKLRQTAEVEEIVITRGAKGIFLLACEDGVEHELPTVAREVFDVSGAGDTVIATIALTLATGNATYIGCVLANLAAAVVVKKLGTATVTKEELLQKIEEMK